MIKSIENAINKFVDDKKNSQDDDVVIQQINSFSNFIKKISDDVIKKSNIVYDDEQKEQIKQIKQINVLYMYGFYDKLLKLKRLTPTNEIKRKIFLVKEMIDKLVLDFFQVPGSVFVLLDDGLDSFQDTVLYSTLKQMVNNLNLKRFIGHIETIMIALSYEIVVQKLIDSTGYDDTSLPNLIFDRIQNEIGLNLPVTQNYHHTHRLFDTVVYDNNEEEFRQIQNDEIDEYLSWIENSLIGDDRMKEFYIIMIYVLQLEIKFVHDYLPFQHPRFQLYIKLKEEFIKRLLIIHPKLAFLIFVRESNNLDQIIKERVLVIQFKGYEHVRLDKDDMMILYREFNRLSNETPAEIYRINENSDGTFDLVFSEQKGYIKKIRMDEIKALKRKQKEIKDELEPLKKERKILSKDISDKYGKDLNLGKKEREILKDVDEYIDTLQEYLGRITQAIEQEEREELQKPREMFTNREEQEFQRLQQELELEREQLLRQEFEDEYGY